MPRQKRDPLIAAMIAKLPDGGEWPVEQQVAWLHLMAMAFGVAYGGDAASRIGTIHAPAAATSKPAEKPKPPFSASFPFYIDEQGAVRNKAGKPINAKDVQGELVDLRGQDGDMKTIRWADGTMGLNGADLTIISA